MTKPKHPPPWLFMLTNMPYGVVGVFVGTVIPFLADRAGLKLDEIGWFGTILFIPPALQFLYAPIVDIGPRRKHWLIIVTLIGAGFLAAGLLTPLPEHKLRFLALVFAAQMISGLVGACNGGLMAVAMPDELRGQASGWFNVGNLSAGGLSSAIAIWMIGQNYTEGSVAAVLATAMVVPSLAVLWIDEPAPPPTSARQVFGTTLRDVRAVLFSRAGLTGIALCLSPVGTAALANYFSGMSKPYGASAFTVALVNGLATTGLTAAGAFVAGYLCDRFNRRALYLTSGALTAICGIAMALSPRTEATFVIGVMAYALITGFCYSAFTATVLETIGDGGKTASTQYSLFVAAGNLAIGYVGFVDTRFSSADAEGTVRNVDGVIWSDALLNLAGVVILGLVFWKLGSFGKRRHRPVPEPELPAATAREKPP